MLTPEQEQHLADVKIALLVLQGGVSHLKSDAQLKVQQTLAALHKAVEPNDIPQQYASSMFLFEVTIAKLEESKRIQPPEAANEPT